MSRRRRSISRQGDIRPLYGRINMAVSPFLVFPRSTNYRETGNWYLRSCPTRSCRLAESQAVLVSACLCVLCTRLHCSRTALEGHWSNVRTMLELFRGLATDTGQGKPVPWLCHEATRKTDRAPGSPQEQDRQPVVLDIPMQQQPMRRKRWHRDATAHTQITSVGALSGERSGAHRIYPADGVARSPWHHQ
jgi:hypothetical protein